MNLATTTSTLGHNVRPYLQLAHCLCAYRDIVSVCRSQHHYMMNSRNSNYARCHNPHRIQLNLRFQLQTPHRHNLQIVREFIHVEQNKFCPCRFTPSHISLWENRLPCDSNVHPVATTYAVGCQHVADRFTCIKSYSFGCRSSDSGIPIRGPLPIPMPNIINTLSNKMQVIHPAPFPSVSPRIMPCGNHTQNTR